MKTPIVMVHGIGKSFKDPHSYYSSWIKYKWKSFKPEFYNAAWSPYAFNTDSFKEGGSLGFRDLASLDQQDLKKIPLMVRLAYYALAKAKAIEEHKLSLPWYKRWASKANRLLLEVAAIDVLDFVGDVFTYLEPEKYTLGQDNPIRDLVWEHIQKAMFDFPNRPIHIVCHSLGTKIVWDILSEQGSNIPEGRIGVLMTLGSPLQPMAIFNFLNGGDNVQYVKPRSVDHWLNVYDIRDVIGAPIGSAAFKRKSGYLHWADVMNTDLLPCANVCTNIGMFPWSAHIKVFDSKYPKKLFEKYLKKYL